MKLRRGYWRWGLGGIMAVAAVVLLTVGLRGLLAQGSELPPALRPRADATPTPRLVVLPTATPTPTPSPSTSPQPTATPSTAPVVRMVIEKLGIDAPVMTLGLDKDNVPEVPTFQNVPEGHPADWVAWYTFSRLPGHGSNAVFSGHVDWIDRLGVFGRLREMEPGDVIQVFLDDGTIYDYRVFENIQIPWDDPDAVKLLLETKEEMVTLVTCGGTWVPDPRSPLGGNYTHRTFVRALRVVD